jgi:hypothetical protein
MATSISEKVNNLLDTMVQLLGGLFGGQGEAPTTPSGALSVPALTPLPDQAPSPVPSPVPSQVPSPVPPQAPPVSTSLSAGGALGSGADSVLFAGILASFLILLIGGRASWPSYELFKPTSALRLAIERPG